jgi:hypothetical protein
MPAAGPIKREARRFLDGNSREDQEAAHLAVTGASSVREAIERVGLLDALDDPDVAESLAVLNALPQAVDRALLATLGSALERGVPVDLDWREAGFIGLHIKEVGQGDAGQVEIVLLTPNGRTFVQ